MEIVILKHYMNSAEAHIDAGLLRSNGIECEVNGANVNNMVLPAIVEQVTLVVSSEYEAEAKELLGLA